MLYKGTTPTHTFEVGIDTNIIATVKIIYAQNNKIVLTKNTEDCLISDGVISVQLSQEDTFLFDQNLDVEIQIRIITSGDDSICSDIIKTEVMRCLENEVLL